MGKKFFKDCLIGCLVSVGAFILLIAGFIGYLYITAEPSEYTDPKDYLIIKEKIEKQDKIKHFPKMIPTEAKEVELYGFSSMPYAGEALMLSFSADKKYIDNELKKNDFINKKDKIGKEQKLYNVYKMNDKFNEKDYTYFVLRNADNIQAPNIFPYYNGIGVNKENSRILYYYMMYGD